MNSPHSPYIVDIEKHTVTHKPTGIVMRFEPHNAGGWSGQADEATIPADITAKFLAGLARRMGDAWDDEQRRAKR